MVTKIIEKMKAQIAVKTAGRMGFKSDSAEARFEVVRENNPESAEFIEDWAKLMQKRIEKSPDGNLTNSVLWATYNMAKVCHENGVDLHQARVLLTMCWEYGDRLVAKDKLA